MDKTLEAKSTIAYGSIYLDTGEDVEVMTKKQIDSFREQLPKFVFFDVVSMKDQIDVSIATRGYVQQELMVELGLDHHQVYVAIAFDDKNRPARTAMREYVKEGKND